MAKNKTMTPLHLQIMLKVYTRQELDLISSTHDKYLAHLIKWGLVTENTLEATQKGNFWVNHILHVPLPVMTFEIPDNEA